jgi:hypothetical protein
MNLENIKRVAAEYDELKSLVSNFVREIQDYDSYYGIRKRTRLTSFYVDSVENLINITRIISWKFGRNNI